MADLFETAGVTFHGEEFSELKIPCTVTRRCRMITIKKQHTLQIPFLWYNLMDVNKM